MATKADKLTAAQRLRDVTKLLLAGAGIADIRQLATDQNWGVTDRQVRRYVERAYKHLAQDLQRNADQLLGRHVMQRHALYARAMKGGDLRTALQVLRDEASLEGLYEHAKGAPTKPDGSNPFSGARGNSPVGVRQRLVRLLAAQARNDDAEESLIMQATPYYSHAAPDTWMPQIALNVMALMYANEQLNAAAQFGNAVLNAHVAPEGDHYSMWDAIFQFSAYRFSIGCEGWRLFCERLGVDGDYLVKINCDDAFLQIGGKLICTVAPPVEEVRKMLADEEMRKMLGQGDRPSDERQTADQLARAWWTLFCKA